MSHLVIICISGAITDRILVKSPNHAHTHHNEQTGIFKNCMVKCKKN